MVFLIYHISRAHFFASTALHSCLVYLRNLNLSYVDLSLVFEISYFLYKRYIELDLS